MSTKKEMKSKLDRYEKMFEELEKNKKIIGVLYWCCACREYRTHQGEVVQDCDGNDIWWGNNCLLCGEVWGDAQEAEEEERRKKLQDKEALRPC